MNDRRAIASKVKTRATEAGRAFAFHFFLRYGDYTDVGDGARLSPRQTVFQVRRLRGPEGRRAFRDAHRQLLTEYALATVEVAFNERLRALARENAAGGVTATAFVIAIAPFVVNFSDSCLRPKCSSARASRQPLEARSFRGSNRLGSQEQ